MKPPKAPSVIADAANHATHRGMRGAREVGCVESFTEVPRCSCKDRALLSAHSDAHMLIFIALLLIALTATTILWEVEYSSHGGGRHRATGSHTPLRAHDEWDAEFARRPVVAGPVETTIIGYGVPHIRPDPDRLIQTEVLVRPAARAPAVARLAALVIAIGLVLGFGVVAVAALLARMLRDYAGA